MNYIWPLLGGGMAPPTDRQMQIADLRNKGLTQEQIAEKLGVARSTVARDWSAVKAEMSDLPIGYEEPTVIEPVNSPNLSNSIVVRLNGIDFEKFRDSNVLYSKSKDAERFGRDVYDIHIFEARNNNIVHSTWLGRTPARFYPRLSKISLKHSIDATKLLADIVDFFFNVIRAIKPETGVIGPGTIGKLRDRRGNDNLETQVNRVFPNITSKLDDSEVDQIYKIVTERWLAQVESRHSELISILNDLISASFDSSAYEVYRSEPVGDVVELILDRLPSISPEHLQEAELRFKQCTKPYDVFGSHVNNVIDTALGMHGIIGDEIPIARYHKIANPELLRSFLESGAQTVNDYNSLTKAGFESTYDRDEFNEMWEVIESMPPHQYTKVGEWEFARLKKGEIHKQLLERNWTRKRLLIVKEVQETTGKRADFDTGPKWIDAFSTVEWPVDQHERQMLMQFTERVGLENLVSWVTPKYDHELINYVFTSRHNYNFPHARATFEALMNRGHVFNQIAPSGQNVNPMDDAFIQKYGLGWAKSDLTPSLYLVLQIVRKSHQKQIPLTNLFLEGKAETRAAWYGNEQSMQIDISENLSKYCVVQPNGIVQIVGRKKQPVSNQDAIEVYEEEREKMLTSLIQERPHNINKEQLSKQLGVKAVELPSFFERVEAEEIHALRLARVIRDDDLPQACHLVWRYFVKLVAPLKSRHYDEDDSFVYDIDFAAERFDLKKGQINVLHDVRKIRNDVDHDDNDIKPPNPTWKRVVGVLKVCELIK
jgi:hypothetical protein